MKFIISNSWAVKLFWLLFLTDLGFITIHILVSIVSLGKQYTIPDLQLYLVEKDRGFPEFFQYMKQYWCLLLLGFIAFKQRSWLYASWMLLFFYLLADDALSIHEKLGAFLSEALGFVSMFRLRSVDFGELLVSGVAGAILFSCIGLAYRFGDRSFRQASKKLLILFLALAVFGVVIDMVHIMAPKRLDRFFGLLEDGGEMIVMSAITAFIFALSEKVRSSATLIKT
ncbi:MAG: hypothetical protein MUC48_12560 [Leptolyngbya sp. Prado105]|nr:hypothetical protein [Leptolyngbya sp. Prado105]